MDRAYLLFGRDPTERVVAVEEAGAEAVLYVRGPDRILIDRRPFRPWLYAREEHPLEGAQWTRLEPQLEGAWLTHLARFPDWGTFCRARAQLREVSAGHLAPASPQRQFLTDSGVTLFKGMTFEDLHRLQFDLETSTLGANRPDARILMIALSDSRGWEDALTGDEREILRRFVEVVRERDPDVLEGHNLLDFDLPYLEERAAQVGVPLALGRDGSLLVQRQRRQSRTAWGRDSRNYTIHGRHVIDTLSAVRGFDFGRGMLESYGLKAVARALGVAEEGRIELDRARMAELVRERPDEVREYALQDVRETRAIAGLICPTDFYQSQMVPEAYQQVAVMGMGDTINALMQREYLHARHPIPLPRPGEAVPGGYTEVRRTGVLQPVVKADVQSLYPSIMDRYEIAPDSDRLGVFLPMVRELTRRRIEAKDRMRGAEGMERTYWGGLQGSFKVLINSFYGYLGAQLHFNDPKAAGAVTSKGQEIVKTAAGEIERLGGQVIEVDTDGVYFVPPESARGAEAAFVERVGHKLPEGINLMHDGSFRAMLSLKVKNYVLQEEDGRLIFHGASMRSRADEPFGREFIEAAVGLLLDGRLEDLTQLYLDTARAIHDGEVPVEKLARRERVTEKTFQSAQKRRAKAAVMEAGARVGDHIRVYQAKGGELKPYRKGATDADRDFYIEKLYKFAGRLRPALEERFDEVFPKPGSTRMGLSSQPSLFD